MPKSSRRYTIGQLSEVTSTKAVTIRYYERLGLLLPAERTASGYRLYTADECTRLRFIRRSRALGFSLEDIQELLELADRREASCTGIDSKVKMQLEQVRIRLEDLGALEAELERLSECCQGGVINDCRIIESLSGRA
jgi:DNA-binding transcriptional MerR regulator